MLLTQDGEDLNFGDLFEECFPKHCLKNLNKSCCYVFLLSHPKLYQVCTSKTTRLRIVDIFDLENNKRDTKSIVKGKDHDIQRLVRVKGLASFEDIKQHILQRSYDNCIGLLIRTTRKLNDVCPCREIVKIVHPEHARVELILGNEMNIAKRYLQLKRISKPVASYLGEIDTDAKHLIKDIDTYISRIPDEVAKYYSYRYVDGKMLRLGHEMHRFLKNIKQTIQDADREMGESELSSEDIKTRVRYIAKYELSNQHDSTILAFIEQICDMEDYDYEE